MMNERSMSRSNVDTALPMNIFSAGKKLSNKNKNCLIVKKKNAKDITNNFRSFFLLKAVNEIKRSIDDAIVESIIKISKGANV